MENHALPSLSLTGDLRDGTVVGSRALAPFQLACREFYKVLRDYVSFHDTLPLTNHLCAELKAVAKQHPHMIHV